MSSSSEASAIETLGWRFGVGIALLVGGYLALGLLPVIRSTDLPVGFKTLLAAFIAMTPALSKVAAIAVMGKPGFQFLQAHLAKVLHRLRPAQQVSRRRYRIGLILLLVPIVGGWLVLRAPGLLSNWSFFWSLMGDAVLIAALFVLGGDFWDKLRALFSYDAKVSFPAEAGG
jgi:hypothetical protein